MVRDEDHIHIGDGACTTERVPHSLFSITSEHRREPGYLKVEDDARVVGRKSRIGRTGPEHLKTRRANSKDVAGAQWNRGAPPCWWVLHDAAEHLCQMCERFLIGDERAERMGHAGETHQAGDPAGMVCMVVRQHECVYPPDTRARQS